MLNPPDISILPFLSIVGSMVLAGISTKLFLRWCSSFIEKHDTWLDYAVRSDTSSGKKFDPDETQELTL